ncbi:unnamed protein product, partial [Closterium sp. Naga37s-1]
YMGMAAVDSVGVSFIATASVALGTHSPPPHRVPCALALPQMAQAARLRVPPVVQLPWEVRQLSAAEHVTPVSVAMLPASQLPPMYSDLSAVPTVAGTLPVR